MDISVIGAGHVGLVTGACFADLGHRVVVVDNDTRRITNLKKGIMPYYEPGLEELVNRGVREKRLSFTTSIKEGVAKTTILFIAVGTPQKATGEADLAYVENVARSIAEHMRGYRLVVEKSTVPVQTGQWVAHTITTYLKRKHPFDVASNPEFLREGSAIQDFMKPDRVVIGVESKRAKDLLVGLYKPLGAPIVVTNISSAELIKHASNSFLSMKISFINAVCQVCDLSGADVEQVANGMGLDPRIGRSFLDAGVGYGGFCFAGEESTFVLNSPNLSVQPFKQLFDRYPVKTKIENVDVAIPPDASILSFDEQTLRPALTGIRCLTRRWYEGPFVELKTMMGRSVRVTADHPIMVANDLDSDVLRVSPACMVREGDYLVSPTTLPSLQRQPAAVDLLAELSRSKTVDFVKVRATDEAFRQAYRRFRRSIACTTMKYPFEIYRKSTMRWPIFVYLRDKMKMPVRPCHLRLFTSKGNATTIPAQFIVNETFMRWLGYYLAVGWISRDRSRARGLCERVGFSFGCYEKGYLRDLHAILNRYGIRYRLINLPGAVTTLVSSRLLAWVLRDVLRCGSSSGDKRLPSITFNVKPRLRLALLQGLFSGNGSITKLQDGRNLMFEYATTSKPLADGVALLLQSIGVIPSIHERWMNKLTNPAYIIRVSGLEQLRRLRNIFSPVKRRMIDRLLRGYKRNIRQRGFVRRKGYALLPVHRATTYQDRGYVYSMETDNKLLVAGSGLVVHNCFPKDVDAFIKIAEQLGYDFQLLKAVRGINTEQKRNFVSKVQQQLWVLRDKTIGVLGLAFKPNTDDMRYAPAIDVIEGLQAEGAKIKAFDPQAMHEARPLLSNVRFCKSPYEVARGADCLTIMTEWNEFKDLDFKRLKKSMRQPLIVDGRNIYDPARIRKLGFRYVGMGRGDSVRRQCRFQ